MAGFPHDEGRTARWNAMGSVGLGTICTGNETLPVAPSLSVTCNLNVSALGVLILYVFGCVTRSGGWRAIPEIEL